MTIIVPTAGTRIDYVADLLSDFHHGAGSQGNTSLLRTQDVAQPDGTVARVPFLSGASIRHGLRDALAWHLARTLDLQPGSLSNTQQTLFSFPFRKRIGVMGIGFVRIRKRIAKHALHTIHAN